MPLTSLICQGALDTLKHLRRARWPAISVLPTARTWELLYLLTLRDLKLRYQDTALGLLWTLMKPLALGAVLFVALKQFVRIQVDDDYHLVLLTALFPWVWFQTSVLLATPSFSSNGALLTKEEWERRKGEWLPTEENKAYVRTLQKAVMQPGEIANWIARPARGIKGLPFEHAYVRLD